MDLELQDRAFLITGGTDGLGFASRNAWSPKVRSWRLWS